MVDEYTSEMSLVLEAAKQFSLVSHLEKIPGYSPFQDCVLDGEKFKVSACPFNEGHPSRLPLFFLYEKMDVDHYICENCYFNGSILDFFDDGRTTVGTICSALGLEKTDSIGGSIELVAADLRSIGISHTFPTFKDSPFVKNGLDNASFARLFGSYVDTPLFGEVEGLVIPEIIPLIDEVMNLKKVYFSSKVVGDDDEIPFD